MKAGPIRALPPTGADGRKRPQREHEAAHPARSQFELTYDLLSLLTYCSNSLSRVDEGLGNSPGLRGFDLAAAECSCPEDELTPGLIATSQVRI